jgi:hypothetical protein
VAVGLSLYFIYALAAVLFLQHLDVSSIGIIESVIIITQVVRLAGIVAYFGSRPARLEVLLVLLSFETFIVMGLIVMYLLAPSAVFSTLAHTIFSTWIASLFVVLPSYLIFTGVAEMTRNRSLVAVMISITLEFGFLSFAASTMLGFAGTFTFGNFFDFLIAAAKLDVASGSVPALSTLFLIVPSVVVFVALLVYTTIPTTSSIVPPKVTFVLPLIAAAASLAWVFATVSFVPNTLLSFTVPGIIIVGVLWAYMRR